MQRFEVSSAVRPIYGSLGVKRLRHLYFFKFFISHCYKLTNSKRVALLYIIHISKDPACVDFPKYIRD